MREVSVFEVTAKASSTFFSNQESDVSDPCQWSARRGQIESITWRHPLRLSTAKAVLTDSHFWIPLVVFGLGVALLVCLSLSK
jgi:hypothetical protein